MFYAWTWTHTNVYLLTTYIHWDETVLQLLTTWDLESHGVHNSLVKLRTKIHISFSRSPEISLASQTHGTGARWSGLMKACATVWKVTPAIHSSVHSFTTRHVWRDSGFPHSLIVAPVFEYSISMRLTYPEIWFKMPSCDLLNDPVCCLSASLQEWNADWLLHTVLQNVPSTGETPPHSERWQDGVSGGLRYVLERWIWWPSMHK